MISVLPKAEGWTVECTACSSTAVPAGVIGTRFASEVPGCVHYDLMRAGVLVRLMRVMARLSRYGSDTRIGCGAERSK